MDAGRLSLGELLTRFIPARATPADVPPLAFQPTGQLEQEAQLAVSLSTLFLLDDETKQKSLECNETAGANSSAASSMTSLQKQHKDSDDMNDLPTLEQLQSNYDPTVQHLDSFMMRTFYFPALEELVLKNCEEQDGWITGYGDVTGFVVRLVRHLTRFRESDAPDSPTCLRRVDLSDTSLFDGRSAMRLMRLLAPHVEFIADPESSSESDDDSSSDYNWNSDYS